MSDEHWMTIPVSEFESLHDQIRQLRRLQLRETEWDGWDTLAEQMRQKISRLEGALHVEHEVQRLMLERLGLEWTPGEPFYSLIDAEITRLKQDTERVLLDNAELDHECTQWQAKVEACWKEIAELRAEPPTT